MKKNMLILFITIFFSSCTAIGLVNDLSYPNRKQKKADRITEPEQSLDLRTRDEMEFSGTFNRFSYGEEEEPFLSFGDSLTIKLNKGKSYSGTFLGIGHSSKHHDVLIEPYWDRNRVYNLYIADIQSIEQENGSRLFENPREEDIHVLMKSGDREYDFMLTEVKHLNYQTFNRSYYGTVLGLIIDTVVIYLTVQSCCDVGFDGI